MTPNERIKEARKYLGISQIDFSARIGLQQGSYSDIERGKNGLSRMVLMLLEKEFNINSEWIVSGNGNMLKQSSVNKIAGKDYGSVEFLKSRVIRYYDVDETGTDMEIFNPMAPYKEVLVPGFSDCELAINIWGDSMSPILTPGEIVLLKEWKEKFIEYGHIYMIVTKSSHRMIKIIYPSADTLKVKCISKNELYPDVEVSIADIEKLYIVKGRIARNAI